MAQYDGYVLLFVLGCYASSLPMGGIGCFLAVDCRRRWGWLLVGVAILLILIATLSGGFHALPWNWMQEWRESQQSEYHQDFQHGATVSQANSREAL